MWLDKCWALRGHAIVWFASATFNGLSTRPDKLPICPIFWGSLTSEELETLSGAGLGRGFSWIFARHVRVPIFLSCKDRSTKPIGRAIFGARAFMLSGRYTWRGYAVSRFTPHRGSNSLWRSAVRRGQKKDIFGLEITRQKQTSPGRAVSVRPAPCGVKNTSIRPIPRRLLPSIDHQICKHHQRQATDPEGSRQIFVIDSTSIGFSCSESPPISTLCETHPAKPGPGFLGSSPKRLEPTFLNGNPGLRNAFLSYLGDAAFLLQ
jgi:hypothetical protein